MAKHWQRLMGIALLMVFIVGAISVLAESNRGKMGKEARLSEQATEDDANTSAMEKNSGRERAVSEKTNSREKALERLGELREAAAEKKEQYLEARRRHVEKKKEFDEQRDGLKKKHDDAKCSDESTDCQDKKKELRKGVQQHLLKTIELIDESLAKLLNRVDASNVLTEAEKHTATAQINALEAKLQAKEDEIKALGENITAAELRTQIKELKALWQDVRKEQRRIIANLIDNKQENIVGIYTRFADKIERQSAEFAAQGADVTQLNRQLAVFNEKVEALKIAQGAARDAWNDAKASKTDEALAAAREQQGEFRVAAKEAKEALRVLLAEFKDVRSSLAREEASEDSEDASDNSSETEDATGSARDSTDAEEST